MPTKRNISLQAPRPGEVDGRDYHYSNREEMEAMIEEGEFIENAEFSGNMYGTSKKSVQDILDGGQGVPEQSPGVLGRHDTLHDDTMHNGTQHTRCRVSQIKPFILGAIRLHVVILSVVAPCEVILSTCSFENCPVITFKRVNFNFATKMSQ
jgi:hypothetical protein